MPPPLDLADIAAGQGGFVIYGEDVGDNAGLSVASAGDVNGDGFDDLIIATPFAAAAGNSKVEAGSTYIVFGKAAGWTTSIDLNDVAAGIGGFVIHGEDPRDASGMPVASAGDLNGDGFGDLIIGALAADGAENAKDRAGGSYVVFGKATGWGAAIDLSSVALGSGGFVVHGLDSMDELGRSVALAGDVNGDGFDDLIIGAPDGDGAGNARPGAGDSYVVFGKASGWGASVDLAAIAIGDGGFVIYGKVGDEIGRAVASAGDINGDGLDDLIIGAWVADGTSTNVNDNRGNSYVVFGKTSGWNTPVDLSTIAAGTGGFVIYGQDALDRSGFSVASAGDVNGDGFGDLIIAAIYGDGTNNDKPNAGDSYVVFGKASGWGAAIDLSEIASGYGGFVLHGQDAGDLSGFRVASAGDVNGDGFDDLIIGAPYADAAGDLKFDAGESYVVFGKASGWGAPIDLTNVAAGAGGFVIHGQDAVDRSGRSAASAGDVDGDGFDDLIIGARYGDGANNAKPNAGESYVVFGRDFTGTVTHAGTAVADGLTGTASADVIVAGQGDDTILGQGGTDALQGGAGNDRIAVGDLSFLRVDGGSGTDTLVLTGTGLTLDLAAIPDTRLQSIEAIELGGNALRITALEVLNLSDTTNTLRVTGSAGATLSFADTGWVRGATAEGFTTFTKGAATLEVQSTIQIPGGAIAPINLADIAAGQGGFVIYGEDVGDNAGLSVASAGDVNGDGFDDLIIATPFAAAAGNSKVEAGSTYIVFGKAAGWTTSIDLNDVAAGIGGFVIHGEDPRDASGMPVASAGDLNGDGFGDLIIGALAADGAENAKDRAGGSYVVFGKATGWGAAIDLSSVALGSGGFVVHGLDSMDELGRSVALAGDVNGDGFDDLIIGAPDGDGAGNARPGAGDSYVVFGKASGWGASVDLAAIAIGDGGFVIYGKVGDEIGRAVASAGDINGDGLDDLIIGAWVADGTSTNVNDNRGNSYVVFGKTSGWNTPVDLSTIAAGTGGFVIYGQDALDRSGFSVASAGDVNGDGFGDLIIAAIYGDGTNNDKPNAGDSYVVFGKASGWGAAIDLSEIASGYGGFVLHGQDAGDLSGFRVASAGDVNGDGFDDLIIGAPYADAAGDLKFDAGESYVVFGKASGWGAPIDLTNVAAGAGGFVIHGQDAVDRSGRSAASAGDVDGDGFDDLIIGARYGDGANNAKPNAGESYVVFGRDFTGTVTHAGTAVADGLTGTASADVIVAGQGDDTILGQGGTDALQGGAGNDRIAVGDLSFLRVDGGSGTDTLVLTGTGLTLDLAAIPDTRLQSIEAIELGGNALRITALEVLNLSDTTNTLRVTGSAGATLSFADTGWVRGATAEGFTTFTKGAATLEVQSTIQIPGGAIAPINLADIAAGQGGFVIYGRDTGDMSGRSVASAGDINGDGFDDLLIGAPYAYGNDNAKGGAGESYVVFGKAAGWGGPIELAAVAAGVGGFVLYGRDGYRRYNGWTYFGDNSGFSVASAGDINGDGFHDLIIGAFGGDAAANLKDRAGDSYVVFGKASGWGAPVDLSTIASGTGGFVIYGEDVYDWSGFSVASAGDVNGDGFDDLIIGAPFAGDADNLKRRAGDSYVVFGKASGWGAPIDLGTIAAGDGGFVIHGQDGGSYSGFSVASAGDLNGDGFDEIIIGTSGSGKNSGPDAYVVFGKASGWGAAIDLTDVAAGNGGFVINGEGSYDFSGRSVASAGDVNGDGFADLIIGAPLGNAANNLKERAGNSYIVFGKASDWGPALDLTTIAAGNGGFVIYGRDVSDWSGWSVASAGDVNGDGIDDLIIGTFAAGESYVVFGKSSGWGAAIDLTTIAAGVGGFIVNGRDVIDSSGLAVASAGDINGDGFDDLIIGAPFAFAADNATRYAGESYVVFGRDFTGTVTHAGTAVADALTGTASADVIVAGQGDDTILGQGGADALQGGAGNDRIAVGDLSLLRVDGGSGTDTLVLAGTGLTLDLAAIPDTRLQSIEAIELGGNALRLTALEVLNLSDTTNTLRVTGDAGAALTFTDTGWVRGTTSEGFTTFTNGQAIVLVQGGVAVPNLDLILNGTAGSDTLIGQNGDDTINGLDGADSLIGGAGSDSMIGGAGADSLQSDAGNDSLDGGSDADWLNFAAATSAVTVDLQNGSATGFFGTDQVVSFEAVLGGNAADSLRGSSSNETLLGGNGADTLDGGAGADLLGGGAGNDLFFITSSGDLVLELADGGADTIITAVNITLPDHVEALRIAEGVSGITVTGGAGNDMLIGNGMANTFNGGAGDDVILTGNVTLADIYALFAI